MSNEVAKRGSFSTNFGFMMAAVGSAVGLGNIWKFPYITGEYGGGAFVLVYLLCIALVGLPLMYAELIIGRRGGCDIRGALRNLTRSKGPLGTVFSYVTGFTAVTSAFLMLSFYSVVAGWALYFFVLSTGLISGAEFGDDTVFATMSSNARTSAICHTVFMLMTVGVVTHHTNRHNGRHVTRLKSRPPRGRIRVACSSPGASRPPDPGCPCL